MKPAMDGMRKVCVARFEAFGTAGQAEAIRPRALSAMARQYA